MGTPSRVDDFSLNGIKYGFKREDWDIKILGRNAQAVVISFSYQAMFIPKINHSPKCFRKWLMSRSK
jgi:hypothetical protein